MKTFGWAALLAASWALGGYSSYFLGIVEVADYSAVDDVFLVCLIAKYSMPHRGKTTGEGDA
jgi:hypothetical protein